MYSSAVCGYGTIVVILAVNIFIRPWSVTILTYIGVAAGINVALGTASNFWEHTGVLAGVRPNRTEIPLPTS
ncbi:hypothetical protein DPMN_039064 [Dreissena polymorpha]|uniref:Uncharacterized protein n=1 Tax=Dreissena polymorpha TaxID=45954 RepID=A0A9D4MI80_DREPO|nr:hypothetical protein DPMN_039064 [Dreissena polymorpha]